jgi:hypothetical protein
MNIQEFKKEYFLIKERGFIEITRKGDGKFGNTFEDLLGLVENNLKTPDIDNWELKVMRKNTSSKQTLFHKDAWVMNPSNFLKNYGIPHKKERGELSCNTTVTRKVNNRGFYLDTDDNYLYIKHNQTIISQYDWETLTQSFITKFPNAVKVYGDEKKKNGKVYFHYNEAYYLTNSSKHKFKKLIEDNIICVDFKLRTQYNKGLGVRNRGTAFRIDDRNLDRLFDKEIIK